MTEKTTKKRTTRRLQRTTAAQSLKILKEVYKGVDEFYGINWENHKKVSMGDKNCYRVTIEILSIDSILKLMEHDRVKNVFWHPSYSPPGAGVDAIALRYRLYVEYI
tara:strand:+ start:9965 stop:10285 length:321 start_codon:yes stop_codon:yes gene_type:complete